MLTAFIMLFIVFTFCNFKGLSFDILESPPPLFLKEERLKNIVESFLYLIIKRRTVVVVVF